MTRRLIAIALLLTACRSSVTPLPKAQQDSPDLAAEYFSAKRAGADDRYAAYAEARESMRKMHRHTTAVGVESDAASGENPPLGKWTFLGPGNVGGRTRVLVIDLDQPEIMFAGGVSGGLWKTTTAGGQWTPVGDDLANIAINSLVMHPVDHNVLYAGTGEGYFREEQRGTALPLRGDGIFVTRDAGETWTQLPSTTGPDFDFVNDLTISTHDPSRVYAATRTGVWLSRNGGETWTRTLPTSVKGGCLDLAWRGDTANDYLFASCGTFEQATVYRNQDANGSGSWVSVLSEPNMGRTTLAIAPSNPSVMYALAASNEPGTRFYQSMHAVYRSSANGDAGSWEARVTNDSTDYLATLLLTNVYGATRNPCQSSTAPNSFTTMGWYCNAIAVDPVNPDRVWAGGVDAFRSDDGGRTWGVASYWWENPDNPAYLHADQQAMVFHPDYDGVTNKTLFFANDGGLTRTDNALAEPARGPNAPCDPANSQFSFTNLNNGYGVTQFYHGAVSPDGRTFIAGAQDNGTVLGTTDRGPNGWEPILGGDGAYVAIDPQKPTTVYASSQLANLFRSPNGGNGWRVAKNGLQDQFLFITPYALDPNDSNRLWIGGRYIWRTVNQGELWFNISSLLPGQVSAIAVQPGNSNIVLAGTNTGHIVRHTSATTIAANTVWAQTKPRDGFVSWLAFDPIDPNTVYATYAGFGGEHVWRSTDAGATWSALSSNLPDMPVHSLAIDPTRRERLYLGTDLGVFVSLDAGASWQVENTGFANAVTETVLVAQGHYGPAVYAFTHGRGAWRAELVFPGPRRRSVR